MLDQTCHSEHQRLQLMFEQAPGFMALLEGPDHTIALANHAFVELVGRRALVGKTLAEAIPEFVEQGVDEILAGVAHSGEPFVGRGMSLRTARADGSTEELLVDLVFQPMPASDARPSSIFIQGHNVTEDRRNEGLRNAHNKVLELAIGDAPLETTLSELIRIVESTSRTGVLGSILLLDADGKHLRKGQRQACRPPTAQRSTAARSALAPAHAAPRLISERRCLSPTLQRIRCGRITRSLRARTAFVPAGRRRS